MIDLSRYDDAEQETWPNIAPLPAEAFRRQIIEVKPWWPQGWRSALRTAAPYLALGLLLGLLPVSLANAADFLVCYWFLGGTMYALGILGAMGVIGGVLGVVGTLCWRRVR